MGAAHGCNSSPFISFSLQKSCYSCDTLAKPLSVPAPLLQLPGISCSRIKASYQLAFALRVLRQCPASGGSNRPLPSQQVAPAVWIPLPAALHSCASVLLCTKVEPIPMMQLTQVPHHLVPHPLTRTRCGFLRVPPSPPERARQHVCEAANMSSQSPPRTRVLRSLP
eukprot:2093458-Amphidinium_carterae.1